MSVDFGRLDSLTPSTLPLWKRVLNDEAAHFTVRTRINWYGERRIEILTRDAEEVGSFSIHAVACKIQELSGKNVADQRSRDNGNAIARLIQQFHNETKEALKSENCFVQFLAWIRFECTVPTFLDLILGHQPAAPFTIHQQVSDGKRTVYETNAGVSYTAEDYSLQQNLWQDQRTT